MFELINVVITNFAKWYKSGKTNKHRRYGFCMSLVVSLLWIIYFYIHAQYWLVLNCFITLLIAVRGVYNNKKGVE